MRTQKGGLEGQRTTARAPSSRPALLARARCCPARACPSSLTDFTHSRTFTHSLEVSLTFWHFLIFCSSPPQRLDCIPHLTALHCSSLHCDCDCDCDCWMRCGCTATRGEMSSEGVRERGDEQRRRAGAHFLRPVRALILSK